MNQILQLASPEQGCIDVPHPVENLIRSEMHLIPGNYSSIIKYCIKSGMEKITPVWNNSDWIITLANPKPIHLYPRARDYTVQASKSYVLSLAGTTVSEKNNEWRRNTQLGQCQGNRETRHTPAGLGGGTPAGLVKGLASPRKDTERELCCDREIIEQSWGYLGRTTWRQGESWWWGTRLNTEGRETPLFPGSIAEALRLVT